MANNISENITQDDIDNATTVNRAVLQERFPSYDLSVGGVVDSLIVNGNVAVTAQNNADTDRAYLFQQLQQIADGEVTVDDQDLDRLMANYFLTRNQATLATGNAVFVVRDNVLRTFQANYRLRANGQAYRLSTTFTVYPVGTSTTAVDFSLVGNVLMEQVYDNETGYLYRFTLPIESLNAAADAVLVAGDRLSVDQPFNGLGYVEASTNFSGGIPEETNQEFATRGLSGTLARTVGGQQHIDALVTDAVQLADSNSVGVNDPMMTRDRDNVFNISTGGKLDTYVKSGAIAQAGYNVTGEVLDGVARTVQLTLTRAQSAGVYRTTVSPIYLTTPPTIVSGGIEVQSVSHNTWTDTSTGAFNPTLPQEIDRAFSARQQIVIVIVDDRQDGSGFVVDMTGGAGTLLPNTYSVGTDYQPGVLELDGVLTSAANRPPGTDILVKAAVPCIVSVGVVAIQPADYNGPDADSIGALIASGINQLPVETTFLDAFTISSLLQAASPDLTLDSVSFTGTIYGQDGTDIAVAQVGNRITLPTSLSAKVSPKNTYFTTTSAQVTVSLV